MDPAEAQRVRDEDHLSILSVFNFVFAGLCLLGAVAFLPHLILVNTETFDRMFEMGWGRIEDRRDRWEERHGEEFPVALDRGTGQLIRRGIVAFVIVFMAAMLVGGVLCLVSGLSLRRRRRRGLSVVTAALQCLALPVGTVLGVITLVVLGRRSVVELYREPPSR